MTRKNIVTINNTNIIEDYGSCKMSNNKSFIYYGYNNSI